jgi:hypothetical protein
MRRRGSNVLLAALLLTCIAWSRASPPSTLDRLVERPKEEREDDALPAPTAPDEEPENAEERAAAHRLFLETERGHWDHEALGRVRALLHGRPPGRAAALLRMVGFGKKSAFRLATIFSVSSDETYEDRIGKRALLTLSFVRIGTEDWEPTPETRFNFALPFHPRLPAPLAPSPSEGAAKGEYQRADAIGAYRFQSGIVAPALRFTLVIREHAMSVTTSNDLLREDASLADRIDLALSNIPAAHLRLIRELIIDPGEHPTRQIAANTAQDGTRVSMFLAGAGRDVPQAVLNETTAHEFGHVVSLQAGEGFWALWDAAILADAVGVSRYGLTNDHEDFAEAYVVYLAGGAGDPAVRARYPRRFALLDARMAPR